MKLAKTSMLSSFQNKNFVVNYVIIIEFALIAEIVPHIDTTVCADTSYLNNSERGIHKIDINTDEKRTRKQFQVKRHTPVALCRKLNK